MKYTTRGLRRRGDSDTWEVILSHKDPLSGDIVPSYHTVTGKTKKAAERARDRLIVDLEVKGGAVGSSMTVREYMDAWLRHKERGGTVEPSTIKGYRTEVKWVDRYIGDVRLSDLTIADISSWMQDMSGDGYAPKSCAKAFRILKQALDFAMAQDLLTKNPCDFCKPPKRVKTPINALSKSERSRMLSISRRALPTPLAIAIELALTTGMRRGEVCALRWGDLSDDGIVTVRRALGNGAGGFYEKEPKTSSSARTIPLTGYTFKVLTAIRKDRRLACMEMGVPFGDPYMLGTLGEDDRPYNPTMLSKDFTAFTKMNNFDCSFHDLRHTFATMLIAEGVDVRTVASYLGHASVSMTLDIYADVDPDAKKAAVGKIEEALGTDSLSAPIAPMLDEPHQPRFTANQLRAMLAEAERREDAC